MENTAPKLEVLKTVRLSAFRAENSQDIIRWAQKLQNAEFFRRCPPHMDWLDPERVMQLWGNSWIIYEEDTPVGIVILHSIDSYGRACEFGMLVDKESSHHYHKTAHQATNQLADYLFDYRNFHKIYVKILDSRDKLKDRLQRIGFTCEATLRDSIFFNGEYRNEYLMSCLKLEFIRK